MRKIIGDGLPIGAFDGREELMRVFHAEARRPVMHSSTFSGNAVSMAAGAAAMSQVDAPMLERLNLLGQRLRDGFNGVFRRRGVRGQGIGMGSLTNLHLADGALSDSRDTLQGIISGGRIMSLLHLLMLERGIFAASRGMYCTSAPMTEADVDLAVSALDDCPVGPEAGSRRGGAAPAVMSAASGVRCQHRGARVGSRLHPLRFAPERGCGV